MSNSSHGNTTKGLEIPALPDAERHQGGWFRKATRFLCEPAKIKPMPGDEKTHRWIEHMAEDPTFPGGILIRRLIEMIPFAIVLGAVLYFRVGGLEEDLHEIRTTVQSDGKEIHKISAELRIYNAQFSNQQTTFQQLNAGEHAEHDRRIKTLDSEVDRMREKVERLERRLIQSGLQGESR